MAHPILLVAEDDAFQRELLGTVLRKQNLAAHIVPHGQAVLDYLTTPKGAAIQVVVLDLNMPVLNGQKTLALLRQLYPRLPVIILTGNQDLDQAIAMMKHGAFDFLTKPIKADRLAITIRHAFESLQLQQHRSLAAWRGAETLHLDDLIGARGSLGDVVSTARKISATDVPVLLAGETGTGKDVLARAIHGDSPRGTGPFVAINCGAIPEGLIESILFGHEKGAFTGATEKTPGKFREAEGGTIFLDEIGDMPLAAQVRLLRVLQQREVQPVGGKTAVPINVRVISASHQDLAARVQAGTFREDLYYRLNVVPLLLPPLRVRGDDIIALAQHFIERAHLDEHLPRRTLSPDAAMRLVHHTWPGNVRELENVIRRAMVLASGEVVQSYDLGLEENKSSTPLARVLEKLSAPVPGAFNVDLQGQNGVFKTRQEIEDEIFSLVYRHCGENIARMADVLAVSRTTIYRWLKNSPT